MLMCSPLTAVAVVHAHAAPSHAAGVGLQSGLLTPAHPAANSLTDHARLGRSEELVLA